ncbi:hypothetical protein K788_0001261 (plasmid) [Paraburkholderia caribensis MBA4]|uniref:Uncharacterized protein n=1 Tax=Paraburkholderia caribensis MBA4 TaxID=1323664 RepID=A0A0P0RN87_9BURK|nr:hypothetical protein K788_0001261 [Paraburkholderia caribensis MBA4]
MNGRWRSDGRRHIVARCGSLLLAFPMANVAPVASASSSK